MKKDDWIRDLYTSGEYWDDRPDFLVRQAPNKIRFLMDFIDFDVIVKKLPDKAFTIADIACGAGKVSTGIAEQLRDRYPDYEIKVYGYDLSPQAIDAAKRLNTEGEFVCGDFKDAGMTWDLALLIDIMEHIPDPDGFLQSVAERSRFYAVGFAMDDNLSNRLGKDRRASLARHGHISVFHETRARTLGEKFGKVLASGYIPNPMARSFRIRTMRGFFTLPFRVALQLLSRRLKGKVFGGESLYILAESHLYNETPSS